jgi:hypothetical protein
MDNLCSVGCVFIIGAPLRNGSSPIGRVRVGRVSQPRPSAPGCPYPRPPVHKWKPFAGNKRFPADGRVVSSSFLGTSACVQTCSRTHSSTPSTATGFARSASHTSRLRVERLWAGQWAPHSSIGELRKDRQPLGAPNTGRFCSRFSHPDAKWTDALTIGWAGENNWVPPPTDAVGAAVMRRAPRAQSSALAPSGRHGGPRAPAALRTTLDTGHR